MSPPSARIPTLDGWRTIAIAMVLLSHGAQDIFPDSRFLGGIGSQGVLLFFAISGYLITMLLLMELEQRGRVRIGAFYLRRAFRLLPAASVYLGSLCVLAAFGGIAISGGEIVAALFLYTDYWLKASWYTSHFWSLAVEGHFYIVWPLILAAGMKKALLAALIVVIATLIWRPFGEKLHLSNLVFQRTDLRLDSFGFACLAAILSYQKKLSWLAEWWLLPISVGTALIIVMIPHELDNLREGGRAAIATLLVAGTVARPHGVLARLLELGLMRGIGRISYSVYLWQQVVFTDVIRLPPGAKLLVIFGIAWLSYSWFEVPFIGLGRKLNLFLERDSESGIAAPSTDVA